MITPGQLRGAFLEYCIRCILLQCGFTLAIPDGRYIYANGNLFFINGKGAAHDADVLMDPPIQMPFAYPTRLLLECKAYAKPIELNIVRSALALRGDINDFEIITNEMIDERKNNRRIALAVESRDRYFYQVGVVCLDTFTKPAIEFSMNNKIPLFSLKLLFPELVLPSFVQWSEGLSENRRQLLYLHYKQKQNLHDIAEVVDIFPMPVGEHLEKGFIAINEYGDYFLLKYNGNKSRNEVLNSLKSSSEGDHRYRIHFDNNTSDTMRREDLWELKIGEESLFFYLPEQIKRTWDLYNDRATGAVELKYRKLPKLFIFTGDRTRPYLTFNIDLDWLNAI